MGPLTAGGTLALGLPALPRAREERYHPRRPMLGSTRQVPDPTLALDLPSDAHTSFARDLRRVPSSTRSTTFRELEGRTGAPSWGTPCVRSTTLGSRNGASWKEKAKSDATLNQLPLLFLLLHDEHHLCASLMHPSTLILCNPQGDARMVVA